MVGLLDLVGVLAEFGADALVLSEPVELEDLRLASSVSLRFLTEVASSVEWVEDWWEAEDLVDNEPTESTRCLLRSFIIC